MKEKSALGIIISFIFKFLWRFLLIDVVIGIIACIAIVFQSLEPSSDLLEVFKTLNQLFGILIIVDLFACIISICFATKKITKKYVINEKNNKKIFISIAIILCIMAGILNISHIKLRNKILPGLKNTEQLQELKKDLKDYEKLKKEYNLSTEDIKIVKKFFILNDIYIFDGLIFVIMIAYEYVFIMKKSRRK